jgi:tetratricopeptide (TPR) repeat protein
LGNQKEALKYKKHALEIQRKLYSENHRIIARSLHNIGISYYKLKDYNSALIYFEQAFKIQCQLIGETSPDKSTIFSNIIVCIAKLRRFQEASERLDDYLDQLPHDQPEYRNLYALKKFIQKEKIRCKRTIPSNKKKKKRK